MNEESSTEKRIKDLKSQIALKEQEKRQKEALESNLRSGNYSKEQSIREEKNKLSIEKQRSLTLNLEDKSVKKRLKTAEENLKAAELDREAAIYFCSKIRQKLHSLEVKGRKSLEHKEEDSKANSHIEDNSALHEANPTTVIGETIIGQDLEI